MELVERTRAFNFCRTALRRLIQPKSDKRLVPNTGTAHVMHFRFIKKKYPAKTEQSEAADDKQGELLSLLCFLNHTYSAIERLYRQIHWG